MYFSGFDYLENKENEEVESSDGFFINEGIMRMKFG